LADHQAVDKPKEPPKPNFAPSGLLAKETNTVQGVQLKYNEPPEARKPLKNWRLYVFKGKDQVGAYRLYSVITQLVVTCSFD
jgi:smad nuclear-interacting protein 1